MSAPPIFPSLPGQGWSIHKRPVFSTIVAPHASGREVRDAQYQNPIWTFELKFDGLASDTTTYPGLGAQSLQTLMGLFLQCQGQSGTFLYVDPTDSLASNQIVATGDGVTPTFACVRALGGFAEPVGWVTNLTQVTVNGMVQSSGWSLSTPHSLVFAAAPPIGATIGATFSYAFQCRFEADSLDFEETMENLWSLQSLKFRSVRSS